MTRDKYKDNLLNQDIHIRFIPMVVDAFGAWDPAALYSIRSVSKAGSMSKNKPYSEYISRMMGKLSFLVMKCNVRALLRRRIVDIE